MGYKLRFRTIIESGMGREMLHKVGASSQLARFRQPSNAGLAFRQRNPLTIYSLPSPPGTCPVPHTKGSSCQ